MSQRHQRLIRLAYMSVIAGTCFQLGSCGGPADVWSYLSDFNPCGTILACDPNTYRFAQAGYEGPGVDVDLDPFCTWPGYCDDSLDPLQP